MNTLRRMQAKYSGKCGKCRIAYIKPGDWIYQNGSHWALEGCELCKKQEEALALLIELEAFMLSQYKISLGINVAEGVHMVETRRDYLEICEKKQAITPEERQLLGWYWSGLLSYSLFD